MFNELSEKVHEWARGKGFYDRETIASYGSHVIENPSLPMEKLLLIVTEISEAADAMRSGSASEEAEEIADAMIRILDYAYWRGIDLDYEVARKMAFNEGRPYLHGRNF